MAERVGFEPTVRLPVHMISNHAVSASSRTSPTYHHLLHSLLSGPELGMKTGRGLADKTKWWSRRGSNPQPHPCEGCALPSELLPHKKRKLHYKKDGGERGIRTPGAVTRTAVFETAPFDQLWHLSPISGISCLLLTNAVLQRMLVAIDLILAQEHHQGIPLDG